MMGDRRKFPRTSKLLQVKVVSGTTVLQVMTTNISPTGAFFASSKILQSGEQVDVFIRPKGSKIPTVKLRAEVIREVHGGGAGQPGFAVRWLMAYSEVGRRPLVQFLRQVLGVPGIHEDLLPSSHFVEVPFPEVGAAFPFSSQRRPSASTGPIRAASQSRDVAPARSSAAGQRGAPTRVPIAKRVAKQQAQKETSAPASVGSASTTPSSPAPAVLTPSSSPRVAQKPARASSRSATSAVSDVVRAPKPIGRRSGGPAVGQGVRAPTQRSVEPARSSPASNEAVNAPSSRRESGQQEAEDVPVQSGSSRPAQSQNQDEDVPVNVPVTYQVYNKLLPGRLVSAGNNAVQIRTQQLVPELNEELVVNVPVDHQGEFRTVFLTGRFMKIAEKTEDEAVLLIHVNDVQEGPIVGAYGKFLAFSRTAPM